MMCLSWPFLICLLLSILFDHNTLLHRLQSVCSISGTVLSWFESYPTGRTQTVTVNDQSSRPADVFFGVPQGSLLGPILFILYSALLSSLFETHSVSNQSSADDTQLLHSCPPDQVHATVLTMQTRISDVKTWMTQNKLKLNDDKTGLSLHSQIEPLFLTLWVSPLLFMLACPHPFMTWCLQPWFMVSDDMSLDNHISNVCHSAYVETRWISSTKTLVCAFVLSKLDDWNSLLSGCTLYILSRR